MRDKENCLRFFFFWFFFSKFVQVLVSTELQKKPSEGLWKSQVIATICTPMLNRNRTQEAGYRKKAWWERFRRNLSKEWSQCLLSKSNGKIALVCSGREKEGWLGKSGCQLSFILYLTLTHKFLMTAVILFSPTNNFGITLLASGIMLQCLY